MKKINESKFLISAPNIKLSPDFVFTEIAFLGRSNVGKSSFINALTNQKNLAKSSSTPGKTQLINFFEILLSDRSKLIFVDLPGFGYAKVSKSLKNAWQENLTEFLELRNNIKLFVHLIDSRHFNLDIDKEVDSYLKSFLKKDQRILNIYTKGDKLNQSQKNALCKFDPFGLIVSNSNKKSIDKALFQIIRLAFGEDF